MDQSPHSSTGAARSERPPVVLQVLPALVTGGAERGAVNVAAAIARAGWTSLVASAGGPMVGDVERGGAEHILLPLDAKNPLRLHENAGRLAELIYVRGVDIVHARSRAPAWSAFYAARRMGCHFVTTYHGTYNAENAVKRWYNSIMAKGEQVIAISEFIAEHVRRRYAVGPDRLVTILRGIDLSVFDPSHVSAERTIALATTWRLPDGMPVIMLPGRLTRWKGQTVLIEALAALGRTDVRCLLVGSDQGRTGYREELQRLIAERGLDRIIHIVDVCRDMPAAYMLADVVVSASTDPEAFGRVAAEAQAMGRPVVATDHGGARETVIPGETGWLVPAGDARALAGAIEDALALEPGRRGEIAGRARAHVADKFTVARMCAQTLGVYRSVLAG
ncbi:MAG: glycosyltransferase [Alphaproteobacteria bacterium]|nr:glycosyltransferase [Alphaproteobacteria bacterium]